MALKDWKKLKYNKKNSRWIEIFQKKDGSFKRVYIEKPAKHNSKKYVVLVEDGMLQEKRLSSHTKKLTALKKARAYMRKH